MQQIKKWMNTGIIFITCTLLTVMVFMAVWQVFSRYILNSPSTISEEFLRYSLIWISMLGAAYAFGSKKHLAIELFVSKLTSDKARKVNILAEGIVLLFAIVVMIIGGAQTVSLATNQYSAALGIPMSTVYFSLIVSGILIVMYSIISIYEIITKEKVQMYAEEAEADETLHYQNKKEGLH
ncbi:TRAP transporter small permease [Cytobacillus gottheilii]|uniref:TRAP transporter small permease n=1 Tax=Cytobacillus gottheilii TaxID=859144 RepID=UPI00082CA0C5|nr:TRAP transporter small permease [Cytobacillus gottheilii]